MIKSTHSISLNFEKSIVKIERKSHNEQKYKQKLKQVKGQGFIVIRLIKKQFKGYRQSQFDNSDQKEYNGKQQFLNKKILSYQLHLLFTHLYTKFFIKQLERAFSYLIKHTINQIQLLKIHAKANPQLTMTNFSQHKIKQLQKYPIDDNQNNQLKYMGQCLEKDQKQRDNSKSNELPKLSNTSNHYQTNLIGIEKSQIQDQQNEKKNDQDQNQSQTSKKTYIQDFEKQDANRNEEKQRKLDQNETDIQTSSFIESQQQEPKQRCSTDQSSMLEDDKKKFNQLQMGSKCCRIQSMEPEIMITVREKNQQNENQSNEENQIRKEEEYKKQEQSQVEINEDNYNNQYQQSEQQEEQQDNNQLNEQGVELQKKQEMQEEVEQLEFKLENFNDLPYFFDLTKSWKYAIGQINKQKQWDGIVKYYDWGDKLLDEILYKDGIAQEIIQNQ